MFLYKIKYSNKTVTTPARSLSEVIDFIYTLYNNTGVEPDSILLPNGLILEYNRLVYSSFHDGVMQLLYDDPDECEMQLKKVMLSVCAN